MHAHLPILPVLLPFATGVLLLALRDLPMPVRRTIALAALGIQLLVAFALMAATNGGDILVYRLGDWPAPWGIVLVADRLAAWMVAITLLLAFFALIHACDGADRKGRHFHVLFQMQLFGINGAFLTGDLFNLFVFFELLLIASYGLLLHGGGPDRVRAGLHYVVLNLVGSTAFLFAAGLLYASLGTLNMAHLAAQAAAAPAENLGVARAGGLLLFGVFALKAALAPLMLWLPAAYAHTSAPVAALFAIMTKVGVYALLRADTLIFGPASGELAGLFAPWLLPLALLTLVVGMLGALAAERLKKLAAWLTVASVGMLLVAFGLGARGVAAGLYYLPHSTFAAALLFLVAEAAARRRPASADFFAPDADVPRMALWGGLFFAAAVASAGLPPLAGFLGKFFILQAADGAPLVWSVVLVAAFLGIVALARAGSRLFFGGLSGEMSVAEPESAARELVASAGLLALLVALAVAAGPAFDHARAIAEQLADPLAYITVVLGDMGSAR